MKKFVAIALLFCMMFALSACGGGRTEVVSDTLAGADIEVVVPSSPNWPFRDDWKVLDYVREATQANIDFVAYPSSDYTTKVSLIMAAPESVPDLMCMPSMDFVSKYVSQGAFVAIDDYEDKMPNYTKFWNSLPEKEAEDMKRIRRSADGKTYYPQVYGRQNTINLRSWLYREDVFKKHNLKTPETLPELYETAKKLKELYPDSYPVCIRGFFNNGVDLIGAQWSPYFAYGAYYDFNTDTWHFGAREDTMREMIEYFKKLSDEKLIPPSYITMSASEWSELVHTDRTFMFPQYQVQIDILNTESRKNNSEFTMAPMMPPRADTEKGQNKLAKWNVDPCGYVVCNSGNEKRISNAFALLDWFYSDEACELLSWGKEGETYEVRNGEKKYLLGNEANVQSAYGIQTNSFVVRIEQDAVMESFSEEQRESTAIIAEYIEEGYNPAQWVGLNEEEEAVRAEVGAALQTYTQEMISKFLLGTEPLSKWDEYVAAINEMGADKLLAAYESAYNRVK
ncbi:MAG: extracellular solute-binding protein [Oscillospiraceae bacterium]|nr:extracellular solute-binding protein [Oscillospiraceae bacterium]